MTILLDMSGQKHVFLAGHCRHGCNFHTGSVSRDIHSLATAGRRHKSLVLQTLLRAPSSLHRSELLAVNDQVKLTLRNDIQRVETETRGTVRHVKPGDDDSPGWHIGVQLLCRLTALDVSLPKNGIGDVDSDAPVWI